MWSCGYLLTFLQNVNNHLQVQIVLQLRRPQWTSSLPWETPIIRYDVLIYLWLYLFPYTALSHDHIWWLHRCHSLKLFHVFSWYVHHWCCDGVPSTGWSLHCGLLHMRGFTSYECPYLHTYVLTYMWSFLVLCLSLTCFGWRIFHPLLYLTFINFHLP
jgi:hypothetical protein